MARQFSKGLSSREKQELKDGIYRHLNLEQYQQPAMPSIWKKVFGYAAAAAVIVLISSLLLFQHHLQQVPKNVFVAKTGNETRQLNLPDGSVVILNALSDLEYSVDQHSHTREVVLNGNAFFKVKKDAALPKFLVHAHSITVSVVGTQFNVNARSPQVEVALTSGKVYVNWNSGNGETAQMLPGDLLKTDTHNREFNTSKMDTLMYSAWTKGQWNFRNTSLAQMGSLMQEYYGADITFNSEKSKNLKMTGVLPVAGLHDLVNVISQTLQVQIKENNNQLFIQ